MALCLFLLTLLDSSAAWQVTDTEIYTPLSKSDIAVMPDGRIFILDRSEKRVLVYDGADRVVTFGKQGKGPGEFEFPNGIILDGDKIYIRDMMNRSLIQFDRDGNHLGQIKLTDFPGQLAKIRGGWVEIKSRFVFGKTADPGQVFLRDQDFENKRMVLDMRPPGFVPPENEGITVELGKPLPNNPTPDMPRMTTNGDGTLIFVTEPGKRFTLNIIDHEGEPVRTIEKDWPLIPFDEEWGDARTEKLNNRPSRGGFKLTFEGQYPDHFPHVRSLSCIGDKIYVARWRPWVEKNPFVTVLDFQGNEVPSPIPAGGLDRVETIIDDHAIVLIFDEEEETAGLAKVALSGLAAFLEANPIPEGLETGGSVMVFD